MEKNFKLSTKIIVLIACILVSSCTYAPPKVTENSSSTAITKKDISFIKNNAITEKLGDMVIIRVPSSGFFSGQSSNISSKFDMYMGQLVNLINKYDYETLTVAVTFPVDSENNLDRRVANNQADAFVTRLEQFIRSRFTYGKGDLVIKKNRHNPSFSNVGNYFEIILDENV